MRGIILAGGNGTRLRPLTLTINKNLIPVGGKNMLLYPLEKMVKAGVKEVCVTTGAEHMGDVVELLKSGAEFGADITYRVQDSPDGISHAISLAENFASKQPVVVILGDNLFDADLNSLVKPYQENPDYDRATVFVKKVQDPERFGVVKYDGDKVVDVIEKPKNPPSDHAIIGVYSYPKNVFDKIKLLKPSARGEYEVTDLNRLYLEDGKLDVINIGDSEWIDAGTHESLRRANLWAYSKEV